MLPHRAGHGQIAPAQHRQHAHEAQIVTDTKDSRFLPFLDAGEESALLAAAPVKSFAQDQVVFDQDVPLQAIFLIDSGSVRVERHDRGALVPLATLGPGEFFGEMSFVAGTPTSARVVADEPTELKIIDEAVLESLNRVDPSFGARLYRSIAAILAERLRLTNMRTYGDQSWG
jgi:extracellular factor (EF) 3-hydroxypalmitic acid methyl ester biosynthesis protein